MNHNWNTTSLLCVLHELQLFTFTEAKCGKVLIRCTKYGLPIGQNFDQREMLTARVPSISLLVITFGYYLWPYPDHGGLKCEQPGKGDVRGVY